MLHLRPITLAICLAAAVLLGAGIALAATYQPKEPPPVIVVPPHPSIDAVLSAIEAADWRLDLAIRQRNRAWRMEVVPWLEALDLSAVPESAPDAHAFNLILGQMRDNLALASGRRVAYYNDNGVSRERAQPACEELIAAITPAFVKAYKGAGR